MIDSLVNSGEITTIFVIFDEINNILNNINFAADNALQLRNIIISLINS